MKIIKTKTLLELPETLETGRAKAACPKPYFIERLEENDEVIWFGYDTNWKRDSSGNWSQLYKGKFVPCNKPEYEILFEKIIF